jgi:hypothetical protein
LFPPPSRRWNVESLARRMTNVLLHLQGGSRAVDIHDDSDLWRIEGPSTVLARSGSRGQGDQVPAPILPKSRRESGLPVLESRQSFSRAQVPHTHTSHHLLLLKVLQTGSCQCLNVLSIVVRCDGLWTSFFPTATDFARRMTPFVCLFILFFLSSHFYAHSRPTAHPSMSLTHAS